MHITRTLPNASANRSLALAARIAAARSEARDSRLGRAA